MVVTPTSKRVFIVEDEAVVAMELKHQIRELGYEVCGHVARASAALRDIPNVRPDLVLMDINLGGGITGIDVAESLRGTLDVPIVFVTAYSDAELAEHAARTEAFGYIVKPFQVQALRANIEMALLRHDAGRRVRESEQRFRALFEQAAVGVAEVDVETGRIERANRKYADIIGYAADELIGLDVVELAHSSDQRLTSGNLARLRQGVVRELSYETRSVRKDGRVVWVGVSISALAEPDEPPSHCIFVVQDIDDRKRAEEAIRASEAKFAGVIAIAKDAIISFDGHMRIVIFNEGAEEIFGYRREEVVGKPLEILMPERFRDRHHEHVVRFASGAQKARTMGERREVAGRRKNGDEFAAEAAISKLQIGGETLFTIVLRDVEERRRQERALRESESRFRSLFEDSTEGVFRARPDGFILDANPALARMLGYSSADDLVGTNARDLYDEPDERARIVARYVEHDNACFETRWRKKTGEVIPVEICGRQVRDESGTTMHFQSCVRDLSVDRERAAREARLLEHSEQLELVLEGTRLGFWDWNPKTHVVSVNARWAEMLGYPLAEIGPDMESIALLVHPADRASRDQAIAAHVAGASPHYECVYRMRHRTGRWLYVLDRGRIFERDEEGTPTRFCGTHTDITAEKEAEHAAIEANRAKTHFLANMSHELRTPLNAILGLSEALLDRTFGELTDRQARSLRTIQDGGRHLRELIDDVLDIARVEAGKLPIMQRELEVEPFVSECIALVRAQASARELSLITVLDPRVATLFADPRRLKQVLVNMLTNAIKFSTFGAPIGVGTHADVEHGFVELWVSNRGVEIAPDDRDRIFEPFVTLDRGFAREQSGAGLGLALVKRLVELHGGTVLVESDRKVGTKFVVRLPNTPVRRDGALVRALDVKAPSGHAPLAAHARRILVVEDNDANVFTVQSYLEARGYGVRVARDGISAVAAAAAHDVDLILMDVQLPLLDGLEAIRRIRNAEQDEQRAERPIIALTAFAMPGDEDRCLAAGATAYVSKPVELKALARRIDELTNLTEAQ